MGQIASLLPASSQTEVGSDGADGVPCQIGEGLRGDEIIPRVAGPSMSVLEQGFHLKTHESPKLEALLSMQMNVLCLNTSIPLKLFLF